MSQETNTLNSRLAAPISSLWFYQRFMTYATRAVGMVMVSFVILLPVFCF